MRLSRISRGLIVAVFVCTIIFLGILDLNLLFQNSLGDSVHKAIIIRAVYVIAIFVLTIGYVYIKDKLYKRKVKRKIAFVYRYIYLLSVILIARYLIVVKTITNYSEKTLGINIVLSIIIALIVKRIVFNISKSDILSVVALVSSAMSYNVIDDQNLVFKTSVISIVFLAIILVMQFLIDELKQKGIKTKKYHIESIIIGILMGISLLFGINIFMWGVILIILLLITINMDTTHLNFPRIIVNSVSKNNKDRLYKIEQININKILVSIITIFIIMLVTFVVIYFTFEISFDKICTFSAFKDVEYSFNNFINYSNGFVGLTKTFDLVLIAYILILEILSFFLRRRYDTKTTIIKTIFIMLYITCFISNIEISMFQPLYNILFVIIAVINTSSLYLNREERIKMLVA